jgi:hypothetical protein
MSILSKLLGTPEPPTAEQIRAIVDAQNRLYYDQHLAQQGAIGQLAQQTRQAVKEESRAVEWPTKPV